MTPRHRPQHLGIELLWSFHSPLSSANAVPTLAAPIGATTTKKVARPRRCGPTQNRTTPAPPKKNLHGMASSAPTEQCSAHPPTSHTAPEVLSLFRGNVPRPRPSASRREGTIPTSSRFPRWGRGALLHLLEPCCHASISGHAMQLRLRDHPRLPWTAGPTYRRPRCGPQPSAERRS